jgi:hypothetical protein
LAARLDEPTFLEYDLVGKKPLNAMNPATAPSETIPNTLPEARTAIVDQLGLVLKGSSHKVRDVLKVSSHSGTLSLKLNLNKFPKRELQVLFDDDRLTFKRKRWEQHVLLKRFRARAGVTEDSFLLFLTHRASAEGERLELPRNLPGVSGVREALERAFQAPKEDASAIFLARAIRAVARMAEEIRGQSLAQAATASTDYRVLLRALGAPEVGETLSNADPLAAARLRGLETRQRLLEESYSAEQVAELLGLSRQAVDERRKNGRLIGLTRGRRGYAYPAWQFEEGRTVRGLEEILKILEHHDPWMQAAFMINRNSRLGDESPISELRRGNVGSVRDAARAYGEQGAA